MLNRSIIIVLCIILPSVYFNCVYGKGVKVKLDVGINFMRDIPLYQNNKISAVVVIPAGSRDIWTVSMETGIISWDKKNGALKKLDLSLGYPANYAFLPETKAIRPFGNGKGPLYTFIIGNPLPTGSIVLIEPFVMLTLDDDESSTILVSISTDVNSDFNEILLKEYNKEIDIIIYWLQKYKGNNNVKVMIDDNMTNILDVIKRCENMLK
jgi:inorganic pyrophosphatase